MEKIKNILKPGAAQDDETLYGSGQQYTGTSNTGNLSGEGSHFPHSQNTTEGNTTGLEGSQISNTSNTPHNSNLSGTKTTGQPTHEPFLGEGSHLERKTDPSGLENQQTSGVTPANQPSTSTGESHLGRDAALGAGGIGLAEHEHQKHEATSGLGNNQSTGLASGTTTSGPHSSNLANKVDPRVDSDNSKLTGSSGLPNTTTAGSGVPSNTTAPGSHIPGEWVDDNSNLGNSQSTTSGHHYGRDATALGTAAAIGEGIHHHNQEQQDLPIRDNKTTSSNIAHPGSSQLESNPEYPTSQQATGFGSAQPSTTTSGLPDSTQGSSVRPTTGSDHHLGRDAAAVGAGGAIAEGIHHHDQKDREFPLATNTGPSNTTGYSGPGVSQSSHHTGPTGTAVGTSGPHSTDTANLLDPAVNTHGSGLENAHKHDKLSGGGAEAADKSHFGRDAGIGAGALGAAGIAEHEHNKHTTTGQTPAQNTSTLPGPAPNTAGPHSKDWMNKLDPRVNANPDTSTTTDSKDQHHLGRDSAVAGGVGAAAYGAEHHKHDKDLTQAERDAKREHKHELKEEKKHRKEEKDHNLGRNTAVAGGIGGAAYEADKHHKHDKDLTQAERDAKREHKHELKEEKKHRKEEKDHHLGRDAAIAGGIGGAAYEADKHHKTHESDNITQSGGAPIAGNTSTTGAHSTTADPTASRDPLKDHHYGRDAGVATGVGAAAYEADKHHKHDKDLTAAEKEAKKEHKHEEKEAKKEHKSHGLLSFLHRDKSKKYTPEEEAEFDRQEREHHSHTGEKAALGAGAVGVAEHEHNKDTHATPLAEKPAGTDLGDKLHGTARNRGVPGESGFPGTEGFGTGASGVRSEATTDIDGNPVGSGIGSSTTGTGHHLGRDAAIGGAGIGATGLAAHEHNKNTGTATSSTDQGSGYPSHVSNSSNTGTGHHLIRDAGIAGGAGHKKHDSGVHGFENDGKTTSTTASTTGIYEGQTAGSSLPSSGLGQGTGDYDPYSTSKTSSVLGSGAPAVTGTKVVEGNDGHNRLHKDPPASHPAAHVPTSGNEREQLTGQGQDRSGHDTGVANGPGANTSTNF